MKPVMMERGLLHCRVCVPKEYIDQEAEEFANNQNPTGISSRWIMVPESEMKDPQRVQCDDHAENVHILLHC